MAEATVSFLLENLTQLIISEAALPTELREEFSWIQTELRVMMPFFQSIDRLHQLSENATALVYQTRKVLLKTEDAIETYVKKGRQHVRKSLFLNATRVAFQSLTRLAKLHSPKKKLQPIKQQIIQVRKGWRLVDLAANSQYLSGFTAMDKLDSALNVPNLDQEVRKCIKWVRGELAPLQNFLEEIDHVQLLGERQKIWVPELRGIFQFIDESFSEGEGGRKVVSEIQDKILQLYRRYYAYGIGEILVNNGSRSIFPRIRMTTPIPAVSSSDIFTVKSMFWIMDTLGSTPACLNSFVRPSHRTMTYLSFLTPGASIESLRVDLKLMKALLEDTTSMGDLDERARVWLNQLQEITDDLEALDQYASNVSGGRNRVFHQLFGQSKINRKLKQIAREICYLTARKMTYGICSALGEAGMLDSIAAILLENPPNQITLELRSRVESVRKELQLMQALFEDVNRMEKLDAGLKFWVEEMLGVAREAAAVLEPDYKNFCNRNHAAWRIKQVYHHIFMISKWKHIYDIGDVKSSRVSVFNHNLAEAESYPSNVIEEGLELCGREINLIQILYGDIEEKDKLDGTAKAWIEEIHNLNWISSGSARLARMKDKIKQLSEIKVAYGIEPRRLPPSVFPEIKEKLLADQEQFRIIPIVGMGRAHKAALQELINTDNTITHHFDWHSWVHAHEDLSGACMARQIIEQQKAKSLDGELAAKLEAKIEEVLMQKQLEMLMHKRYLIVLDEIQSIEVWQRLEQVFSRISTGSRIILFSNEHTCSLLNSKAISKPVKLGGPPSETSEVTPGSHAFNINSVPSYLRQCLYYFLLFPANFEVPTRRLIVLWAAEGSIRRNEHESDEDVAYRYLNELMKLNIVHGKTKKLNGKYKACQLNEDLRDKLSMRAKESRFFQGNPEKLSRLVDHHGACDSCFIHIDGNPIVSSLFKNYQSVLSFMSFNTQEGNKPGEDIGNFLNKFISAGCFLDLRVLDLEKVFRPKLPEAICNLILLKYLGLRWTYLEHLPKYVNKLLNLQVLDVKHTYISILPKSIWSMEYLRHLYLSETYRTKFVGRPSEVSLDELQTLWGAFIDEDTYVRNGLDTAHNIRKLGLACRTNSSSSEPSLMSGQLEAVNDWISNLTNLNVLRLKSRDERGKASELHLKPLRSKKLSTVYLLGKLDAVVVSEFPENLTDITLSGSELNVDPMISLEKLKQLRILRLLSQSLSVGCKSMRCSKEGFPQLKVFKIWKLENLEEWEVEEGALRSLEDLEIRSCEKLKVLPDLQHVSTLRECMLTSMSEEFIDETKFRQPALRHKIKASS